MKTFSLIYESFEIPGSQAMLTTIFWPTPGFNMCETGLEGVSISISRKSSNKDKELCKVEVLKVKLSSCFCSGFLFVNIEL